MMKNLVKVTPDMYPTGALVYVAQPFGGDTDAYKVARRTITNVYEVARRTMRDLIKNYPRAVFISPILQYGFMYEDVEYIEVLEICINLLRRCDRLLLLPGWKDSRECIAEWATARELGIPIYYGDGNGIMRMESKNRQGTEDGDEK